MLWAVLLTLLCLAAGEASVQPPAPALAAHLAGAALSALEDATGLEKQISEEERLQIDRDAANPLETFHTLHDSLGLLFDTALAALRHATAATAGSSMPGGVALAEAANLEAQLTSLLAVQSKEPLFFWHGPKRLALSKLRRLIGQGAWHQQLKELSASASGLELSGEGAAAVAPPEGPVPPVGVVVDEHTCRQGASCPMSLQLQQAAAASKKAFPQQEGAVHLLVLPCSEVAMKRIGSQLEAGPLPAKLYVSLSLPESLLEAKEGQQRAPDHSQRVESYVGTALKALGRSKFDLVWLPYAFFKKQHWTVTKRLLENHKGDWAYGIHAEVPTLPVAEKLLVTREPLPAAWLSPDDLLRPALQEAVKAVRKKGIACVSLPRANKAPDTLAAHYYSQAGLLKGAAAAQLQWAWHRGLAGSIRGQDLADAPVYEKAVKTQWLTAPAFAVARLQQVGNSKPPEPSTSVEAALLSGSSGLQQADAGLVAAAQKEVTAPGVSESALSGLGEQAKVYKANNHVIYRENFFDDATFAAIKAETQRLWKSKEIEANCNLDGKNRLGGYILDHSQHDSSLYHLIYGNEQFRQWVSAVNDEGDMWPSDFPIELREYGQQSKGMGCHPDLQMYKIEKKDLEFAFTVDNDSRCNVTFFDASGKKHLVQTKPNSMMMVRVNAATHCVSSTEGGTRSILKFIYVGDYRKSQDFWMYTENQCDERNPNRRMITDRRASRVAEEAQTSLEL
eukprot:TRINITY_DN52163_c0_g1_i1.p1 TRINITY_DN52163_c0_g1~~TRINITY_DN52163_c0_g1_i1.p1  ORF type:complete len:743 (-),score=193.11 TRINITY_DN52163_c0_g1_i1:90-2291(-)